MRYIILSLFLLHFPGSVDAQNRDEQVPRSIYFVVDASGSMKTRMIDAERALAERFSEIVAVAPSTSFSRTEFHAKLEADCDNEIAISDLGPASSWPAPPSERSFAPNDFTPLGSALSAAIKHAGKGPADIYLASDWAQSPDCGITVEEAMRSITPDADIAVIPVVVRPTDSDLKFARAAARSQLLLVTGEHSPKTKSENHGLKKGFWYWLIAFFEAWIWFLGFLIISSLAIHFGWRNTKRAIHTETRTKEIKSLQRAALYDQNMNAEQKLQSILRSIARERKRAVLLKRHIRSPLIKRTRRIDKLRSWSWRSGNKITSRFWPWQVLLGLVVSLLLFAIAASPEHFEWLGFSFENIRSAAWRVLNSDFATAFAIIWIVTIFFAARQFQRRIEIDEEFSLATDEAGWVALAEERRAKDNARELYRSNRKWVAGIEFKNPWYVPSKSSVDEDKMEIRVKYEAVKEHALDLALRDPLDESSTTKKQFENEVGRLNRYGKWRRNERSLVPFKRFVSELLSDQKTGELATEWDSLLEPSGISSEDLIAALNAISLNLFPAGGDELKS